MPPSFSGLYFRAAQRSHSSLHETKVEYIFLCSGFAFVFWINDIRTLDSQIFMISMCIWLYYFCKYKQLRLLLCKIHWIYLFIHVSACVIFTGTTANTTTFEPYSWKYAKNFIVKLASVRYSRLGAQTANDCRSRYVANTHIRITQSNEFQTMWLYMSTTSARQDAIAQGITDRSLPLTKGTLTSHYAKICIHNYNILQNVDDAPSKIDWNTLKCKLRLE